MSLFKHDDLVILNEDGKTYKVLAVSGDDNWLQLEGIRGRWIYVDNVRPADEEGKT